MNRWLFPQSYGKFIAFDLSPYLRYPLVNVYITMEKSSFLIAMLFTIIIYNLRIELPFVNSKLYQVYQIHGWPKFPRIWSSICSLMWPGAPGLMMFMAGMLDTGVPGMLGNILGGREAANENHDLYDLWTRIRISRRFLGALRMGYLQHGIEKEWKSSWTMGCSGAPSH